MKPPFTLTGFHLKYLALILMVLDHIHYFFDYTGRVPLWFSQLGRLAAPLFLFCVIEGFCHTKNRKAYIGKIYALAILMGFIQFGFYNFLSSLVRPDGFFPKNMMLSSLFILLTCLQGLSWIGEKKYLRGWCLFLGPLLLPLGVGLLYHGNIPQGIPWMSFTINLLHFTVLPLHTWISDGGTALLVMGIVMYLCRKNLVLEVLGFVLTTILFTIILPYLMGMSLSWESLWTQSYEWLSVFAAIPMLFYSGQRGRGSQVLFYWFYPVHIYFLYLLSLLCYR